MKKKKKTKHQTHQFKKKQFKEQNLQKKTLKKHTIQAFSSSLLDTVFCGDLKGESCTTSLRLRHLLFDGVPS